MSSLSIFVEVPHVPQRQETVLMDVMLGTFLSCYQWNFKTAKIKMTSMPIHREGKPRDPFGSKMCTTKVYCVLYCTHFVQQCSEQLTGAGELVRE